MTPHCWLPAVRWRRSCINPCDVAAHEHAVSCPKKNATVRSFVPTDTFGCGTGSISLFVEAPASPSIALEANSFVARAPGIKMRSKTMSACTRVRASAQATACVRTATQFSEQHCSWIFSARTRVRKRRSMLIRCDHFCVRSAASKLDVNVERRKVHVVATALIGSRNAWCATCSSTARLSRSAPKHTAAVGRLDRKERPNRWSSLSSAPGILLRIVAA